MRVITIVFLLVLSLFLVHAVSAADFINDYKAEYFLTISPDQKLNAHVKFTLTMTNLRSDVYVKKVTLGFPRTFVINGIKASDNTGPYKPDVTSDAVKTNILIDFHDPSIGKDSQNIARLEFDQENLFKVNGNVWEVILPTVEDTAKKNYQIIVCLRGNFFQKKQYTMTLTLRK